jgi:hypothetical protein
MHSFDIPEEKLWLVWSYDLLVLGSWNIYAHISGKSIVAEIFR